MNEQPIRVSYQGATKIQIDPDEPVVFAGQEWAVKLITVDTPRQELFVPLPDWAREKFEDVHAGNSSDVDAIVRGLTCHNHCEIQDVFIFSLDLQLAGGALVVLKNVPGFPGVVPVEVSAVWALLCSFAARSFMFIDPQLLEAR